MGLLDDVMVNVKSAANSVGKKTNEIVDYSKLRFTASGLNNEIRKKYQTLGEEVYTSTKIGSEDTKSIELLIKEIDELANTLIYANNEINKTDELRRDLLSNVSHDLKTPLTMIKAYAEMLRDIDNLSDDKKRENLNIIIDETDRLNILVNDILNLSKLESNKEILDKSEFDLVELIKKIVKKFDILVDFRYA